MEVPLCMLAYTYSVTSVHDCALRYQTALNVGSTTHAYTCNVISIYDLLCHKMLKYI